MNGGRRHSGFSLVEQVVAMSVVSILIVAMGSAVVVAAKALDVGNSGPNARTTESARLLEQVKADLSLAIAIDQPLESTNIEFTIPDRDNDTLPERIRYEWLGMPNYRLTRQLHYSKDQSALPAVVLAEDVRHVAFNYLLRSWGPPPPPPQLESNEVLLMAHDDAPAGTETRLLMVVVNSSDLSAEELDREALVESWGYTVSLIEAAESQAAFDVAVANADVVYVPQPLSAADLADKLVSAPVGVVNERVDLVDDLGLAATIGSPAPGDALDVIRSTHYITSPLGEGLVSLFSSPQAVTDIGDDANTHADELQTLGRWGSAAALSVLEAGARLVGGPATPPVLGPDVAGGLTSERSLGTHGVATQVTLPAGGRVTSMSAYLHGTLEHKVRYAIYTDAGGEPGALIAQTAEVQKVDRLASWFPLDLPPTVLTAGTYWLALWVNEDAAYFYTPDGESRHNDQHADDGFASDWGLSSATHTRSISIHADGIFAGFAGGRRVQLPWGDGGFDINALTLEGRLLLRRALEWAADAETEFDTAAIEDNSWIAQYFRPHLPENATEWSVQRVLVAIRAEPAALDGKVRFQLRNADAHLKPLSVVIQQTAEIPESTWDPQEFQWYEIPFNARSGIPPNEGLCLVIEGRKNQVSALLKMDRNRTAMTADTHLLETSDNGSTWSDPGDTADLRFYLYGTYTTIGEPQWP